MTYWELLNRLFDKNADEKGIVRGAPVMLMYMISKASEKAGVHSPVDSDFLTESLRAGGIREALIEEALGELSAVH